ncbi:hypothetical protein GWK47_052097 [Chionoecetes opilio]|uniref:Uncharacterized protein n=1 Tax=Chionoecetes opilio TaxID=41210 RepID=A0A8J4YC40_CHIOP|nr:hypothetical protein GWK47_052097 [Chionoecetes opilio]
MATRVVRSGVRQVKPLLSVDSGEARQRVPEPVQSMVPTTALHRSSTGPRVCSLKPAPSKEDCRVKLREEFYEAPSLSGPPASSTCGHQDFSCGIIYGDELVDKKLQAIPRGPRRDYICRLVRDCCATLAQWLFLHSPGQGGD